MFERLNAQAATTTMVKKTMKITGPSVWNSVPDYIQELTSIHSFKSKLKAYLIEQYDNHGNQNSSTSHLNNIGNTYSSRRMVENNYYGLASRRPAGIQFQSRWNDGPNDLI